MMERRLLWEEVEVEPRVPHPTVVVPIAGNRDQSWEGHFEWILRDRQPTAGTFDARHLEHPWGAASYEAGQVRVEQVPEGTEGSLRDFLQLCLEAAEERHREEQQALQRRQQQEEEKKRRISETAVRMRERLRGQRDN